MKTTKRKTVKQKQTTGTNRPDKEKNVVLFSSKEVPDSLDGLTKRGQEFYHRLTAWVQKYKILAEIDNFNLTILANAYDKFLFHMNAINSDSANGIVHYQNGSNVNGDFNAMNHYLGVIDKFSKKYGLDQESREKLLAFRTTKPDKEPDGFEKL